MNSWEEDLLAMLTDMVCEKQIFQRVNTAAQALGFDYVSYGVQLPLPVSNPKAVVMDSYPRDWQQHYASEGYMRVDPTVKHGQRSSMPLVWTDQVFKSTPRLWDDARAAGLRVGWAQSCAGMLGVAGMLSLSRSSEPLTEAELSVKEIKMRWLVNVSHLSLARAITGSYTETSRPSLTGREIEVLKWSADGKSAGDISYILNVSVDTVNFHIKNAIAKLNTSNKTAAVVRAVMLGMLG